MMPPQSGTGHPNPVPSVPSGPMKGSQSPSLETVLQRVQTIGTSIMEVSGLLIVPFLFRVQEHRPLAIEPCQDSITFSTTSTHYTLGWASLHCSHRQTWLQNFCHFLLGTNSPPHLAHFIGGSPLPTSLEFRLDIISLLL